MAYKNLGGAGGRGGYKGRQTSNKGKNLGGQPAAEQEGVRVFAKASETEPPVAEFKNYRQRGTVSVEFDAIESVSAGVTQVGPDGKRSVNKDGLADALLSRDRPEATGVTVGYHVDKDGHFLTTKDADGKDVYVMDMIERPTDKSSLADVSDRYLKAIESDPRYQEALKRLEEMFQSYRDEPWAALAQDQPPAVSSSEPRKDAGDRFTAHYSDFYSKLTGLHLQGGYDKNYDSAGPVLEQRDAVRKETAMENPEMDTAVSNKARHWLNVQDQLMKHGCDFQDCEFIGKDGKALGKLPPNATEEQYQRYTDALVYAMDHDMLSAVKTKDGKEISGLPVKDEYTANLKYYDDHAADMEKYRAEVEAKTAEGCKNLAETHKGDKGHPNIAGCEITAVTNEQYYADAQEKAEKSSKEYASRVKSYEAGKNPMLDTLQHFGLNAQEAQAQAGPTQPSSQRRIEEALSRADAVKSPDSQREAEMAAV